MKMLKLFKEFRSELGPVLTKESGCLQKMIWIIFIRLQGFMRPG